MRNRISFNEACNQFYNGLQEYVNKRTSFGDKAAIAIASRLGFWEKSLTERRINEINKFLPEFKKKFLDLKSISNDPDEFIYFMLDFYNRLSPQQGGKSIEIVSNFFENLWAGYLIRISNIVLNVNYVDHEQARVYGSSEPSANAPHSIKDFFEKMNNLEIPREDQIEYCYLDHRKSHEETVNYLKTVASEASAKSTQTTVGYSLN